MPRSTPDHRVLLTTLRHDLRAPVGDIIGYAELLLDASEHPERAHLRADLERIVGAGRSLLEQVDTVFNDKAISGGTVSLEEASSRMRHDFRTPLNHVIGYSELLIEELEDDGGESAEATLKDLTRIRDRARALLDVVDRAFSKDLPTDGDQEERTRQASALTHDVLSRLARDSTSEGARVTGRVLVVDDNELNREMLGRRVRAEGHEVLTAASGAEALDMLESEEVDTVLLDIIMPGMDGFEVLRRLKEHPTLKDIPVIMISALTEVGSAVRGIQMGAEDYLPKPFDPVVLGARLGASLEKKRLRDREARYLEEIEAERARADELLHVILPQEVVQELKSTNAVKPRRYENVAVLFADIVGFTAYSDSREPEELVTSLQELVRAQEELTASFDMDKIKTIGDSFMAAAGLLRPLDNPVRSAVRCGLAMIDAAGRQPSAFQLRVGVHIGPVVAGLLGRRQFLFDVIGDTVNTAARVVRAAAPDTVALSDAAWRWVEAEGSARSRGLVELKGKGEVEIYHFLGFHEP